MNDEANTIIDRLGGTTAVAKLFDIKPPSVHGWRSDGIPKYRLQFLRLVRPDVFEGLNEKSEDVQAPA
ncbi:hypothetical protein ACFSHT_22270 [Paraburkholderia silviterrae]|uniref:Uncharacterized protein n=1 Tax=Paraburkholderia silviterrae TaxID=2528715 RepID=A0A4R5MF60_9BURK|nr:hypothetical protein [Paraburkholderia silviterrae]TDG25891.1 hypothetical protein EYW47_00530 [Paraburkholderia silviterrae]